MTEKRKLSLFEGSGIELEYMIVNRDTLDVLPVADELLKSVVGSYSNDFDKEGICWSNELALHVVELGLRVGISGMVTFKKADNIRTMAQPLTASSVMVFWSSLPAWWTLSLVRWRGRATWPRARQRPTKIAGSSSASASILAMLSSRAKISTAMG